MSQLEDSATTVASYTQAFASALEAAGVDPQEIFSEVGVGAQVTSDPLKRISNAEVSQLFHASVRATGNPCFGIEVGERMQPGNLHALGFAMLASVTLRDFYNRVCNYYRVVSRNADFEQEEVDGASVLVARNLALSVCNETQDAWLTMMVRFLRFLYQQELNPLWIDLCRPVPAGGEQPFLNYFQCSVRFDCDELRIAIDSKIMDRELPGGSADLAQHHDQIVMQYLEKMEHKDVANRVRRLITDELSSGTLSKQGVAEKMNMSARNLQLKLAERNTTFQETLDGTRQNLAAGYIEQSHLAVTEIAYLLGFSDASNFTRAFRRWHGCSPSDYRAQRGISEK
jgi:AraC-like DNA-binding protein